MKIINVVGARPNFMKVAPIHRAFKNMDDVDSLVLHTGQHYDEKMSDVFFNQLGLPKPDYYLGVGGGSHTSNTARVMQKFEEVIEKEKPDVVLVVGDVDSTVACTLVAVKMGVPVVHVESGLRSGDRKMPEEINRILTDSIADLLFVTEQSGMINLAKENVPDERVRFVGNVMIDTLVHYLDDVRANPKLKHLGLERRGYILMTMHRPSNVDSLKGLQSILQIITDTCENYKVVFAIHPRTMASFEKYDLKKQLDEIDGLIQLPPQGYMEFLELMDNAYAVITDSGGIQEETTYLKVRCLTFRSSTERPITVELGTNVLLSSLDPVNVKKELNRLTEEEEAESIIPPLWDGKAAQRVAKEIWAKYETDWHQP
jgi:UDP-N-acetylglucosamine 2-epimerase (non-hydrolysing)